MTHLGKNIQLKGLSQRGKNRIREHGNVWTVLAETDHVLFSPNDSSLWLFIVPIGGSQNDKASRWIRFENDKDFTIVIP